MSALVELWQACVWKTCYFSQFLKSNLLLYVNKHSSYQSQSIDLLTYWGFVTDGSFLAVKLYFMIYNLQKISFKIEPRVLVLSVTQNEFIL